MLLVQKYLETKTFSDLEKEHGVYASFSKSGEYFSLNYDMIESKEDDPLAQECRGLILAPADGKPVPCRMDLQGKRHYENVGPGETIILCFGMKRFFNYGQGACAPINWDDPNLKILEKLDGTLCQVWYNPFNHIWNVATRSCPDADLLMGNGLFTFRTLFNKAWLQTMGFPFGSDFDAHQHKTYCFELTTPLNRIVVNYSDYQITLLAVRNLTTLQEEDPNDEYIVKHWQVPSVKAYTYTTVDELLNWVSTLDPSSHEGVVVIDSNFNRIKVKNAAYCAANRLRDTLGTSPRNCLEIILLGKDDDVASFLPQEIQENIVSLKENFILWLDGQERLTQMIIDEAKSIASDKKTFALTVQKYKPNIPAALFSIYDGKANSIKSFIDNNRKNGTWSNSFLDKILSVI